MKRRVKKIIFLILIITMIAGLTAVSQTASASAGTFRATSNVNLRAEPSTEAKIIRSVTSGSNVEVLQHDPAGWSSVKVGDSTGFIRSDFLKFPIGESPATFRTTNGVNVRSEASTESSILTTVASGSNVEVTDHNPAGWSKVKVNGKDGFIRSDFLTRGGSGGGTASGTTAGTSGETVIATLKTKNVVNMRSGSSTDTSIIRTLASGVSVEVLENLANGWSRVSHNNAAGFIRSDLLTDGSSSSSSQPATTTLKTTGTVNMRAGPSVNDKILKTLQKNTSVEVTGTSNGWSSVKHGGTSGFIRSDLLSATGTAASNEQAIAILKTVTGVRFRTGPSTNHTIIRVLPVNTSVDVLENESNGWSRVRHNGTVGYIRSDLIGSGARTVELLDWSTAKDVVPINVNLSIVDVRTGITYTIKGFSKSGHIDVEPVTQADTDAIFKSRNGVWSWAARPVWVTVNNRTFAAALNGMPHDVSTIRNNGMNGHLCLHFNNTVTNSQSYQRDLRSAVTEAYNARPQ